MQHMQNKRASRWLMGLASPWLTLASVAVLILMAVIGAVVPQHGMAEEHVIRSWQQNHSTVSPLLMKISGFSLFVSPAFLVALVFLFINTLACTCTSLWISGLFNGKDRASRMRRIGFLGLHISILICMAGGFISAAFRMRGKIILTEGQLLNDRKAAYTTLVEGPFRKKQHDTFSIKLLDAEFALAREWDYGRKSAVVEYGNPGEEQRETEIAFNEPLTFNDITFTLHQIGYSPQIIIRSSGRRMPPFKGFISLKTWGFNEEREHRDFLPLPRGNRRLVFTLLPSHEMRDGSPVKTGELPDSPALLVHLESDFDPPAARQVILPGHSIELDQMNISFGELRQWASFLVVRDPGYPVVCLAFWMAAISLAIRYTPDIREWIRETKDDRAN